MNWNRSAPITVCPLLDQPYSTQHTHTSTHWSLFWCKFIHKIYIEIKPFCTHWITGSMAAILSVRICSSPFVTSFKAGPELLANTTWRHMDLDSHFIQNLIIDIRLLHLPQFLEREALWQKASLLEWCPLHYYLRKTRHTCEEDPARENQDGFVFKY